MYGAEEPCWYKFAVQWLAVRIERGSDVALDWGVEEDHDFLVEGLCRGVAGVCESSIVGVLEGEVAAQCAELCIGGCCWGRVENEGDVCGLEVWGGIGQIGDERAEGVVEDDFWRAAWSVLANFGFQPMPMPVADDIVVKVN